MLGHILFLIYINDFPNSADFLKFTLFADDSNLLCKFENVNTISIYNDVCQNLNSVYDWLSENKIKVNVDKCKYIIFSYGRKTDLPPLKFGTGTILQTSNYKFLGITLDQNLNFREHVNTIKSKLSKSVGVLFKLNKFLPPNILKLLYDTLVKPCLTYGIEAWFSVPNFLTDKIFITQKNLSQQYQI